MPKSKCTKGDWYCRQDNHVISIESNQNDRQQRKEKGLAGETVVIIAKTTGAEVEDVYNAQLISASKELLEACQNLLDYIETGDMKKVDLRLAKSAIKKATGE
jgi:regulator of sigma D